MEAVFIFDTGLACDNIGQGEFYESRLRYFLQSILSSGISNTGLESSQAHIETTIFLHISMDGLIFRYRGNHGIATTMFFQVCFSLRAA